MEGDDLNVIFQLNEDLEDDDGEMDTVPKNGCNTPFCRKTILRIAQTET